jgi:uroporphyrinogen-III synthase
LLVRLDAEGAPSETLADIPLACIGPVTALEAARLGSLVLEARQHTLAAVVDELDLYFSTGVVRDE